VSETPSPTEVRPPDHISSPPVRPPHPVELRVTDDLRRSRLTVFFRLLLFLPHAGWIYLWSIAAVVAWLGNWIFTLILGRSPEALRDFLTCYLRYTIQIYAYLYLSANPYPGFLGIREYPVDVEIEDARQRRLITAFRPILAIPALLLSWVFLTVYGVLAIVAWFICLVVGRIPKGLRDLGLYMLRYEAQTRAYITFLTDRYPSLSAPQF
jgi:Domain of unknown function (DUF4389)